MTKKEEKSSNNYGVLEEALKEFKDFAVSEVQKRGKLSRPAARFLFQQLDKKTVSALASSIPSGKKYTKLLRIAKNFGIRNKVPNYLIARCIVPTVNRNGKKPRLTKKDYMNKRKELDKRINNAFRALRRLWKPLNYSVHFHTDFSEVKRIVTQGRQNQPQ